MSQLKNTFRFFDVTLRDSLQTSRNILSTVTKKRILRRIVHDFSPNSIEVGSINSHNTLSQLADSEKIFEHALDMITSNNGYTFTPYIFVQPDANKLDKAVEIGCDSVSIPSSVSEAFQQKTANMSIDDTHQFVVNYARYLPLNNIKIYLSCVNYCPVSKKTISPNTIAQEVTRYIFYKEVTQVCLTDTTGTLIDDDLIHIMTILKQFMIKPSKIGLHLHASPTLVEKQRVAKLLGVAKLAGIKCIDVSLIGGGGYYNINKKGIPKGNLQYSEIDAGISYLEKEYEDLFYSRRLLPFCQSV
jgi:isopropylmalate/homocitrate/citramalate synthase